METAPSPIAIGQTYGLRTVVAHADPYLRSDGYADPRWVCVCLTCGLKQKLRAFEIRRPQGPCCRRCRNKARRKIEAPFNRVVHHYKANAMKRGFAWALSDEEAMALFTAPCHYCGTPPTNCGRPSTTKASDPQHERVFLYSGLDRKDNSLGYVCENVVSCCRTCNWAKGKRSYADFLHWLDQVTVFRCRPHP